MPVAFVSSLIVTAQLQAACPELNFRPGFVVHKDQPPVLRQPVCVVTDGVGILSSSEIKLLESEIASLKDRGLAEAVVYIIRNLPSNVVMEQLTLRSVNAWGVGDAKKNNGLAIFVFIGPGKVRIELGKGLEKFISNDEAAAVMADTIVPAFQCRLYGDGLLRALKRLEVLLIDHGAAAA